MDSKPQPQSGKQSGRQPQQQLQYWTISTTLPPSPALKIVQWHYQHYCQNRWATVDQAIVQSIGDLPPELKTCLHHTLAYEERKALRSVRLNKFSLHSPFSRSRWELGLNLFNQCLKTIVVP